jgi:hypothetical protein
LHLDLFEQPWNEIISSINLTVLKSHSILISNFKILTPP